MRHVLSLFVLLSAVSCVLGQHGDPKVNGLVNLLKQRGGDTRARDNAWRTLGKMAGTDRTIIPILVDLVDDPVASRNALHALQAVKPAAKEAADGLLKKFDAMKSDERSWLVSTAMTCEAPRHDVLPLLIRMVRDTGGVKTPQDRNFFEVMSARKFAAQSLRGMGPEAAPAVPALLSAIKEYDGMATITFGEWGMREACFKALGAMGSAGREALPVLEGLTTSKSRFMRLSAQEAIAKIRADGSVLARVADGHDTLTEIGEPTARLASPDVNVRREAVRTIIGLERYRGGYLRDILLPSLQDPDLEVRLLAAHAIEECEKKK